MEHITATVKKWGNSLGIILPKKVVRNERIKEGVEVEVSIQPENILTVEELMRFARKQELPEQLKKSTTQIMKEIDTELWPE
jgi:antitoxin component of MazEF toxin-antitoxin module